MWKFFSTCYRPSVGIRVWRPDFLTSYVVHVPKTVCFFEAAFENGLRFPLHLSSSASFNTSMYAQPSFPPTSGAFWLTLLFLGIKA